MSAATPITSATFAMFEPTMLPAAIETEPSAAARAEIRISGALVPTPITSAPISTAETRRAIASRLAPRTS